MLVVGYRPDSATTAEEMETVKARAVMVDKGVVSIITVEGQRVRLTEVESMTMCSLPMAPRQRVATDAFCSGQMHRLLRMAVRESE